MNKGELCCGCFLFLGSLALLSIGIMYLVTDSKDTRYASSLVTIDNITMPGRYCGICAINYCCAVSTTANLTTGSHVQMWYMRDSKRLDVAAVFEQPYRVNNGKGMGCLYGGGFLFVISTAMIGHARRASAAAKDDRRLEHRPEKEMYGFRVR